MLGIPAQARQLEVEERDHDLSGCNLGPENQGPALRHRFENLDWFAVLAPAPIGHL